MNALLLSVIFYALVAGCWKLWQAHREQQRKDQLYRKHKERMIQLDKEMRGNKS